MKTLKTLGLYLERTHFSLLGGAQGDYEGVLNCLGLRTSSAGQVAPLDSRCHSAGTQDSNAYSC